VFVPDHQKDAFLGLLTDAFRRHQDPRDLTTIVDDKNYQRVVRLVDDARTRGAQVIEVAVDARVRDPSNRRIPPTILVGVTDDMDVSREEIFGPVLAVHPYKQVDEVIAHLNARPSPLVSYWYGSASSDFHRFRVHTRSGGMTRNDFSLNVSAPGAPFGGVGQSGMGAYHGRVGFDTFSHLRTVTESVLPWSMTRLLLPPLPARAERVVLWALAKQRADTTKRLARR
jgi:coniferyl-aldehyde dehydrogenase